MSNVGADSARADTASVEGPFERTYRAKTVNLSEIADRRLDHETADTHPEAAEGAVRNSEIDRDPDTDPPASGAQKRPTAGDLLTVGTEYEGVRDTLTIEPPLEDPPVVGPSDAQIAVGYSKTVQAINQTLAIFNQRSGTLELTVPFERLFDPLLTEDEFIIGKPVAADPRLRYDPGADRFVLSIFYMHFLSWSGSWLLAVSDGSNPNGDWHLYRIPTYSGDWPDYPPLGLDRDAIYLTAETIPPSFNFPDDFDEEVAIVDKEAAYNGSAVTVNHFTGLLQGGPAAGIDWIIQPAFQPYSGGQSGPYYLMNVQLPGSALTLWEVTDPLEEPSLSSYEIDIDPWTFAPDPRQPDPDLLIDPVDGRLMNLDYDDGSLWTAHTIGYNWDDQMDDPVAAIRWYELDPLSRKVVQSGTYGAPGTSYFLPRIESDGDRTLMGYNVSGPETFPGIEVAGRTPETPGGEMEASTVIQEGESSLRHPTKFAARGDEFPIWWGDYMGISVHPETGNFWLTGQYSPDYEVPLDGEEPDRYQTHIAEVLFEDEDGSQSSDD